MSGSSGFGSSLEFAAALEVTSDSIRLLRDSVYRMSKHQQLTIDAVQCEDSENRRHFALRAGDYRRCPGWDEDPPRFKDGQTLSRTVAIFEMAASGRVHFRVHPTTSSLMKYRGSLPFCTGRFARSW